jgi:ribonuclease D
VLGAPQVEWVLHAGLQDVELITRHFSVSAPARLFDTQIAWGLLSPEASVSLAYLTYRLLHVRSEKAHQADDWVQRPLQSSQLRYAAADVEHLGEIQERLLIMADKLERVAHLYQATSEALLPPRPPRVVLSLNSFRNAWQLSPAKQAALQFIIRWYNALSPKAQRHVPESKVLLSVAAAAPTSLSSLGRIKGVSPSFVQQYGQELVAGMQDAVAKAASADYQLLEPAPYATFDEIRLDAWLTGWRAHLAVQLQFAPELVLPGRVMKEVKTCLETQGREAMHDALDGYRRALLVEESARFCANRPPPV